MLLLKALLYL